MLLIVEIFSHKTSKQMFNMQNAANANIREAPTTSTLLDLIVTTRTDLMGKCGIFPLGISDHDMLNATIKLKNNRPPPNYIKTRDYRKLDIENFRQDFESAPFHIVSVFDEPDDILWAWQTLFKKFVTNTSPRENLRSEVNRLFG